MRICRWCRCQHPTLEIDTESEPFEKDGNFYFHQDCYRQMMDEQEKKERIRNDILYIRHQWGIAIDESVSYSHLTRCLNELIDQGYSSDYLVFAFDYIVSNGMNLRYPAGLKYFVARHEIKRAYQKELRKRENPLSVPVKMQEFKASDVSDAPTFQTKKKKIGFSVIQGVDSCKN